MAKVFRRSKHDRSNSNTQDAVAFCGTPLGLLETHKSLLDKIAYLYWLDTEGMDKLTARKWKEEIERTQKTALSELECLKSGGLVSPQYIQIMEQAISRQYPEDLEKFLKERAKQFSEVTRVKESGEVSVPEEASGKD